MIGRTLGFAFGTARDALARLLVRLRVTPNTLSLVGMVLTAGAGVCYALGATSKFGWSLDPQKPNGYLLIAFVLLVLSSACDMLDGAVARIGRMSSPFGAFLDSTLDRYSDFAVYAGIAAAYAFQYPGNVTFILLSMLAFFNAAMISYTRARAEDIIEKCSVGYWQRGERSAAILIATAAYNIPALVVQQAALPLLTVLRRIFYTKAIINGQQPIVDPRLGGWSVRLLLWRWPRKTLPYDFVTGINIAWLIFVRIPEVDVLRMLPG